MKWFMEQMQGRGGGLGLAKGVAIIDGVIPSLARRPKAIREAKRKKHWE